MFDFGGSVFDLESVSAAPIKHNPTDFEAFHKAAAERDALYEALNKEKEIELRRSNLRKWDAMIPARWSGASLSKVTFQQDQAKQCLDIIDRNVKQCFYLYGEAHSGKTYIAHAIVRRLIGKGVISPSEVKVISEDLLLTFNNSGYVGQNDLREFFDPKYKLYLVDDFSSHNYDSKSIGLIERFIDHIYSNSLICILTSANEYRNFVNYDSNFSQSFKAKFDTLFDKGVIVMRDSPAKVVQEMKRMKKNVPTKNLDAFSE